MLDPFDCDEPTTISFSGGRTSAMLLAKVLERYGGTLPGNVGVIFANTGLEHPKTYEFVQRFSDVFRVDIHWVEYRGKKGFERVEFGTHSTNGEPFSLLIDERKYLPNVVARFCTVELKIRTIDRYANSIGFDGDRDELIGMRADEMHRVHRLRGNNRRSRARCPLADAGIDLADVMAFWSSQPFDLEIPTWQGNCQGCFLKGLNKLDLVARETPEALEWWAEQESKTVAWRSDGSAKTAAFRSDRPGYRAILIRASAQPTMFPLELAVSVETDFQDCHCTD